jgi:pyruvate formate lyase activating enzyme
MDEDELFEFFEKRKNQLGGICITGGEPTIQKDLPEFIQKLKDLGYKIKLDSNGTNPKMLEELIKSGNLDYIAMDIKSQLSKYSIATNTNYQVSNIKKSIELIMSSDIDYEFRTTVCHPIHEVEDFEEIGKLIKGAKRYYIQNFVKSKHIDEHQKFTPFTDEELARAKKISGKYIKEVKIR